MRKSLFFILAFAIIGATLAKKPEGLEPIADIPSAVLSVEDLTSTDDAPMVV